MLLAGPPPVGLGPLLGATPLILLILLIFSDEVAQEANIGSEGYLGTATPTATGYI